MNAGSITGRYGREAMSTAHVLLKHRWVHFLASDAHSKGAYLSFPAALSQVASQYGEELAHELTVRNPGYLLVNIEIPSAPLPYSAEPNAVKRFWNLFTRKK
jgi:protein-tyrosine phosphatase